MDIKEKAREYALNVLSEDISKIEQAYLDGYKEGQLLSTGSIIDEDGIEYFDLGLPSGTMWSKCLTEKDDIFQCIQLPYLSAKELNIPTMEQVEELKTCKITGPSGSKNYIGPNGNSIRYTSYFWIKNDAPEDNFSYLYSTHRAEIEKGYIGDKHCIVLVKNREDFK